MSQVRKRRLQVYLRRLMAALPEAALWVVLGMGLQGILDMHLALSYLQEFGDAIENYCRSDSG